MKNIRIIDAHTHAHFRVYDVDREAMISRALEVGIGMVTVGTDKETSAAAVRIAEQYEGVYASIGLHPIHTHDSFEDENEGVVTPETEFDFKYYKKLAAHPKVVAIGECGLDYFHLPAGSETQAKKSQEKAFQEQIRLAHEVQKPLMIHCRSTSIDEAENAYADVLRILGENKSFLSISPGIMHFFSGSKEEAQKFLDCGFYFTFGGAITLPKRKNGADFETLINLIPMEKILVETDAPYVAPLSKRGQRNEPLFVEEVVQKIAEIRGIPLAEAEVKILENTKRVFGL